MTYGFVLTTFIEALIDVMLAAFAENPAMWCVFIVAIVAAMLAAWDALDRRGMRASAWALVAAVSYGLAAAIA